MVIFFGDNNIIITIYTTKRMRRTTISKPLGATWPFFTFDSHLAPAFDRGLDWWPPIMFTKLVRFLRFVRAYRHEPEGGTIISTINYQEIDYISIHLREPCTAPAATWTTWWPGWAATARWSSDACCEWVSTGQTSIQCPIGPVRRPSYGEEHQRRTYFEGDNRGSKCVRKIPCFKFHTRRIQRVFGKSVIYVLYIYIYVM